MNGIMCLRLFLIAYIQLFQSLIAASNIISKKIENIQENYGYNEYLKVNNIIDENDVREKTYSEKLSCVQERIKRYHSKNNKIIAVTLNRHIYSLKHKDKYFKIVNKLCDFLMCLIKRKMVIVFLPFNTSFKVKNTESNTENDILFHSTDIINI